MNHFRKLLSICTLLAATLPLSSQTVVYGYRTYQDEFGMDSDAGVVSFTADGPSELTAVSHDGRLPRCYAGAYYNYHWYGQFCTAESQLAVDGWYRIDPEDGSRTLLGESGQHMLDLTYSYRDETFYGLSASGARLLKIDLYSGRQDRLRAFTIDDYPVCLVAIAAALDGRLFGIGEDATLYYTDPTTCMLTPVGPTGVRVDKTNQSLEFDHTTKTLYWSNTATKTFYTVDTSTGAAQAIGPTGQHGDHVTALAIPYINSAPGSPGRVTDRKAVVDQEDGSVALSWTPPTIDCWGMKLMNITGTLIYRDNSLIASLGSKVYTFTDHDAEPGHHAYRIRCTNSFGMGSVDTDDLVVNVGPDAPGPVVDFKVTPADSRAVITWLPPTEGRYGGAFDAYSITGYLLTRQSGAVTTEIELSPEEFSYVDAVPFGTYTYSLRAFNDLGQGAEVRSAPRIIKPADWIVMHEGAQLVKPGVDYAFYDAGGPDDNYPDAQITTMTLRPADRNGYVTLHIDSLLLERGYDTLAVHDGTDTSAPLLGTFTGTLIPADSIAFATSNAAGALTLRFVSDRMENRFGWRGRVTYVSKLDYDLELTDLTGDEYPRVGLPSEYTIAVTNRGCRSVDTDSYVVELLDDCGRRLAATTGPTIRSGRKAEISLVFTPETIFQTSSITARLRMAADARRDNDHRDLAVVVIDANAAIVRTALSEPSLLVAPASFTTPCSIVESLYPASTIGRKNQYIKYLQFFYNAAEPIEGAMVEIYVGETDRTSLAGECITADRLHLFYKGPAPVHYGNRRWSFSVAEPYFYTGGNLVVLVNKYGADTDTGGVTFCGSYNNPEGCTRFAHSYTLPGLDRFDPEVPFGHPSSMLPDLCVVLSDDSSDVGAVSCDSTAPIVRVEGKHLTISGNTLGDAKIYAADGRLVATLPASPLEVSTELPLPGIYVVVCGQSVTKIAV